MIASKLTFLSNYFTCYSSTDTQGSQKFIPNLLFTCRHFDMAEIVNNCTCVTEKLFDCCHLPSELPVKIQPAITSFSTGEFRQQPVLSDNPA